MPGMGSAAFCSVCDKSFNVRDLRQGAGQRLPRLLGCGHAACEQCVRVSLNDKSKKSIVCGLCKYETPCCGTLMELDSQFPLHLYIIGQALVRANRKDMAEPEFVFQPPKPQITSSSSSKKVKCDECESATAVCICKKCSNSPYCDSCFTTIHSVSKSLRSHQRDSLYTCAIMCLAHPENISEMFCTTCMENICSKCCVMTHKDHDFVERTTKNEELLPAIQEAMDRAELIKLRLKMSLKEARELSRGGSALKARTVLAAAERDLVQHAVLLHGQLQLQEGRAAALLAEKRSEGEARCRDVEASLAAALAELGDAIKAAHSCTTPENLPTADLEAAKSRLDRALAVPCHLVHGDIAAQVRVAFRDQLNDIISVDISKDAMMCLSTEEDLPASYVIPPLDVSPDSLEQNQSNKSLSSQNSTCSSQSSTFPLLVPAGMKTTTKTSLQFSDPLNVFSRESTSGVIVTHIKNPSEFYVIMASAHEKLTKLSKIISKFAMKSEPARSIEHGKLYAVKASDKSWYRGIVIPTENNREVQDHYIKFVDYGSIEKVTGDIIRELPCQYTALPAQAVKCSLLHTFPPSGHWDQSALNVMAKLTQGILWMHVMETSPDKIQVDLFPMTGDGSAPSSLRDTIVHLGVGSFQEAGELPAVSSQRKYPKHADLPLGVLNGHVLISSWLTPSHFYVQKDLSITKHISDMISSYLSVEDNESRPVNPYIGMPCLGKYSDGNWYRARITSLSTPGYAKVFFVDYGNSDIVDYGKINYVPESLLPIPELAVPCSLHEVAPLNDHGYSPECLEYTRQFEDTLLKMEVVSQEKDHYKVFLYMVEENNTLCINGLLVQNKFAQSTGHRSLLSEYQKDEEDLILAKKEHKEMTCNIRLSSRRKILNKHQIGYFDSSNSDEDSAEKLPNTRICKTTEKRNRFLENEDEDLLVTEQENNEQKVLSQKERDLISSEADSLEESSGSVSSNCLGKSSGSVSSNCLGKSSVSVPGNGLQELFVSVPSNCLEESSGSVEYSDQQEAVDKELISSEKIDGSVLSNYLKSEQPDACAIKRGQESVKLLPIGIEALNEKYDCNRAYSTDEKLHTPPSTSKTCSFKKNFKRPFSSVQSRLKQAQSSVIPAPHRSPVKEQVVILSAESPSCIFVRRKSEMFKVESMIKNMLHFYEGGGLLKESLNWRPDVSEKCAVKSSVDSKWYRAVVLDVLSDSQVKVNCKDIGRIDIVSSDSIRKLAPVFLHGMDGSIKCHLTNVKPAGGNDAAWSSMACDTLNEILKEHSFNLYFTKKGEIKDKSIPVLLWACNLIAEPLEPSREHWFTINQYLVERGAALPIDWSLMAEISPCDYSIVEQDDSYGDLKDLNSESSTENDGSDGEGEIPKMKDSWLPAKQFFSDEFEGKASYVDHDACVYLQDNEDSEALNKVCKRLNRMFVESKPGPEDAYWFENQMCSVRYHVDGSWYRGKVIKLLSNNMLMVQLVDYGNVEECRSVEVRKKVVCRGIPILARKCRVRGLKPVSKDGSWDLHTLDMLHNLVVDQHCIIRVLREPTTEDDVHVVDLTVKNQGNIKDLLAANIRLSAGPLDDTAESVSTNDSNDIEIA
ncbi:uncharacterized protein LOC117654219 isoform X2 [Thrips palmi]|uniref:Uncharacterized protein LOC117654219 isoform X2 n=1 Tax=Thrips palmi TaxID=161013 RepID=A0A6P9ADP9_THRPL|nr:uncharacterized protein LOC117654219 isoform X2 [Thrips palmi]